MKKLPQLILIALLLTTPIWLSSDVIAWPNSPFSGASGDSLPDQTGNSGKFLTTDGTNASWGALAGGGDLLSTNNLSDVASASTALSNLGGEPADADITKADVAETITESWNFTAGLTTGSSATPSIIFKDSDCTDNDTNVQLQANATDTGSGTEDVDFTISQQVAGTLTDTLTLDADATNPLSIRGWTVPHTYSIQATITEPDQLAEADKLILWKNTTGSTFTITAIYAISDADNTAFVLDEYDADGASNTNEIDSVTCTDGSGPYTVDITSGISHTAIEDGHVIAFDASASTPNYVFFVIKGHF